MAEESVNYAEYTVTKKAEGSNRRKRILLIYGSVLFLKRIRTKFFRGDSFS